MKTSKGKTDAGFDLSFTVQCHWL